MSDRRPSARTVRKRARESWWTLVTVVLLVAAGLVAGRWISGDEAASRSSGTDVSGPTHPPFMSEEPTGRPAGSRPPDGVPVGAQPLTVAFTRDGDTLEANALAAGVPVASTERIVIRLLGIDAPETHGAAGPPQCYARDAYHALQRLAPNGSTVWVLADRQLRDRYERYLLYVWNAGGAFVNDELARAGYARSLDIRPNLAYQGRLDASVAAAERERRGLWGRCLRR